jgi:hypothetical protein
MTDLTPDSAAVRLYAALEQTSVEDAMTNLDLYYHKHAVASFAAEHERLCSERIAAAEKAARVRALEFAGAEAERYASHYPAGSDGRNTFLLLADRMSAESQKTRSTTAIDMTDGWRPIGNAPKDGTVVDLWGDGERWTDCFWGKPEHCCGEEGSYCDSDWHGESEGWVYSTLNMRLSQEPTHFRPLPAPPQHGGENG